VTPTTAQFVTDTAIYNNDINSFSDTFGGTNTTVLKADGLLYELYDDFPNTNANGVRIHDILNNTEITLLSTTAKADADAHLGTSPDPNHMGFIPVPYTPYFYNAFLLDDLFNPRVGYLLYKIAAGAISLVGCVVYQYLNGFRKNFTGSRGVGVLPSGEVAVAYFGRSINHASYLTSISAPADVDGAFGGTVSGDATLDLCCELPFGDNFLGGVTTASDRAPVQVGFAPDPNPLSQALTVFFYVDKARCQQELISGDNTYIATQAATHPNGFMLTASYAGGAGGLMTWVINGFLKKGDGSFDTFDDAGLDSTGVAGNDFDDWFAPAALMSA
jgi:hypothetical protein